MTGCTSSSRWLVVLWVGALLSGVVTAATHTQTVTLTVQGMV